jgi:hypothetical protein
LSLVIVIVGGAFALLNKVNTMIQSGDKKPAGLRVPPAFSRARRVSDRARLGT